MFEPLVAGTAAGELDSQQLDADAFAKRLFDLGAAHLVLPIRMHDFDGASSCRCHSEQQ